MILHTVPVIYNKFYFKIDISEIYSFKGYKVQSNSSVTRESSSAHSIWLTHVLPRQSVFYCSSGVDITSHTHKPSLLTILRDNEWVTLSAAEHAFFSNSSSLNSSGLSFSDDDINTIFYLHVTKNCSNY